MSFCRFVTLLLLLSSFVPWENNSEESNIVIATKQIQIEEFPGAFNPSLIKVDQGFLLVFRYCPNLNEHWINYIGLVLLDETFIPIATPQLLNTRIKQSKTPSQAEDARIFSHRGRLFLIYNDNLDTTAPQTWERRDMFIAELFYTDGRFFLSAPLKLVYEAKYHTAMWQKNWTPFDWNGRLMLGYSINPHEVLFPNLFDGSCYHCYDTWEDLDWKWGVLRGSAAPLLVDGEYLNFFHSGVYIASPYSGGWHLWHYFMGAYTFSAEPPFELTKISPEPIIARGFYTVSGREKRVIFPGGFVVSGDLIYLAYGKDDCEIWIATLDKTALMKSLIPAKVRQPHR